jgi:holo-[acyl-carrier protein] synthase
MAAAAALEARIDLRVPDQWPVAQPFVIISAVIPGKP